MFNQFINQYSLSKTLRFELRPVGETAEYLEDFKSQHLKDFVKRGQQRAEEYQAIKKLIDEYHRVYIEEKLSAPVNPETGEMWITPDDLEEAFTYYQRFKDDPKSLEYRKEWENTQENLRKKLVKIFSGTKELLSGKLITQLLPEWLNQQDTWDENKGVVESFKRFTSYFTGLHENRRNMYTHKDQSTAIAYRLMNENLPRFFSNCLHYQHLQSKYHDLELKADETLLSQMSSKSVSGVFQPRYFINLFAQSGIDSFQELIGGKSNEDGSKVKGLNELINLFRQQKIKDLREQAKAENKKSIKIRDLSGFAPLFKQILSESETRSFIPVAFESDAELLDTLKTAIERIMESGGLLQKLEESLSMLGSADRGKVYVKTAALRGISNGMFSSHAVIPIALSYFRETSLSTKKEKDAFDKSKVHKLQELDGMLLAYVAQLDFDDPLHNQIVDFPDANSPILSYFREVIEKTREDSETNLATSIAKMAPILELKNIHKDRQHPKHDTDRGGKGFQQVQAIQNLLDAFLAISHAVKPFHLVDGRKSIDMPDADKNFYNEFASAYEAYTDLLVPLYNKTRNHLTKKSFSKEKVKINFGAPTLLNGWDLNKETSNKSIILRRNGNYYLAIMHPKHSKIFTNVPESHKQDKNYEKLNYKLLPDANKMLPKVFFSKKGIETFNPPQHILELYKNSEHKKGNNFKLKSCHRLIDFFKKNISKYKVNPDDKYGWDVFSFKFSPTHSYNDLSDFYREVKSQGYKVWFSAVSAEYINTCIGEGKLFLFQIYNKDFSPHSKGKPNLHTLYWKGIFETENLKDVVIKLDGEAEIFYREHSIAKGERVIHPKGIAIANKNQGNNKKHSTFEYDLVKDRRYTVDKFQFHVPITLNFKAAGVVRFNDHVNSQLARATEKCIIGIDRGERHLLYYSVINQKGVVIEQGSLNSISTDQGYEVDYQQKLHSKESERDKARKIWSSIENIKELKAGYLSHVIHKLAGLILKHNAIVCLEDLNFGFKRGRFKIEKQVYQKFEKALIDKLNFLVNKDAKVGQAGHYLRAYQLTAPFQSFEKLGKQSGILFYVQAAYTSKIDPATGFIDFLRPRYESLLKSKIFFEKIDDFKYLPEQDYFAMKFDYSKLKPSLKLGNYPAQWTICTHGDTRYHNKRNQQGIWKTVAVNVTEQLKQLFDGANIQYAEGRDLKGLIADVKDSKFYHKLFKLLHLTLSLRHSVTNSEEDFILSPVADRKGRFYDSRVAAPDMPLDADANGAYHIALKGLWNLQQINGHDWDADKLGRLNLAMKNEQWLNFLAEFHNK